MRVAVLLLAALAMADTHKKVDVVCPLDGTRFTATEVVSTDASLGWGGVDTDTCRHAFRTLPMEHYVWTCPACSFSGTKDDFNPKRSLSDDTKRKLKGALKPAVPIAAKAKQEDIPGWVKYDLLAQVEAAKGSPPLVVAWRHLNAAWAARQSGAVRLDDYDDWVEASTSAGFEKVPLDLGKKNRSEEDLVACKKLESDLGKYKGTPLLLRRYLLAMVYRRRGENVDALRWLDELDKSKGENSIVDDAAKQLRESIAIERAQQAKAAALYAKAVEDASMDSDTKFKCLYQLGEISRRSGDKAAAEGWYQKALQSTSDEALKKRVEAQRSLK
jgi:uncharacterized protein (DUF2225 family)